MARATSRLKAQKLMGLPPGRHSDGDGLYLVVGADRRRAWILRHRLEGKRRDLGLGGVDRVGLKDAREIAAAARAQIVRGVDPIEARRAASAKAVEATAPGAPTFGEVADAFVEAKSPQWRNEKHRAQWKMTLTRYAAPIRRTRIDEIGTDDILKVLEPIWMTKPETASRLRGRIEAVLDAARVRELRTGENPARWRGHLDHLLAAPKKLTRGHHSALPYAEIAALMSDLRARPGMGARALEFTILCASRSGETVGASPAAPPDRADRDQ